MQTQHTQLGKMHVPAGDRSGLAADVAQPVDGEYTLLDGELFFKISNSHRMDPFFMSLVSADDHWMFIASNGALTAGRRNSDSALFPYYSSDKLLDLSDTSGVHTIFQVERGGRTLAWKPFARSDDSANAVENIYKNRAGTRIVFESINEALQLAWRYSWTTSPRFGFIRSCQLVNLAADPVRVRLLDGLVNLVPSGLAADFQLRFSNLADAYKRCELDASCGLGMYYLSSIPSDRAEPCEGLRATTVWQTGLDGPEILLTSRQVSDFRRGERVHSQCDARGQRGSYLVVQAVDLSAGEAIRWKLVADVNQDLTDIVQRKLEIREPGIERIMAADCQANEIALLQFVASSDGGQVGNNRRETDRHRANVTFNIMRGGVPVSGYQVVMDDFQQHLENHRKTVSPQIRDALRALPATVSFSELQAAAIETGDPDLLRIANEYLPLTFSRRHGDPTRPWNQFSIDVRNPDGSRRLNYEGNWRDLFQNWEALGISFPKWVPNMLLRFVNATTADGYNPYRVTKSGFEWERPDPSDPWANIGYWGDHQVIYQAKLLELALQFAPDCLDGWLDAPGCVFANVPYRIAGYQQLIADPRNTITYDHDEAQRIESRVAELGSDGQLLHGDAGLVRTSLFEKLLISSLTKLVNLIPDAGIWLNTQRPEWNDANNALVGSGCSVVTACYLRRLFSVLADWIGRHQTSFSVATEVSQLFDQVLDAIQSLPLTDTLSSEDRRSIVDRLQKAASDYRAVVYGSGFSGQRVDLSSNRFVEMAKLSQRVLEATVRSNRRQDGLYHAYNLIRIEPTKIVVSRLYEMLEGQVAVLSSGMLTPAEAVEVVSALRASRMYRADQQSYLLYPDRELPSFLEKNRVENVDVEKSGLLKTMVAAQETSLIRRDADGAFHFNGDLRNAADVRLRMDQLKLRRPEWVSRIEAETESLVALFETTFDHASFTGRSGTFFGYEGLGSIYWHMVSKLAVAVQENYVAAFEAGATASAHQLKLQYEEIRSGLGLEKNPACYGAFPTDPYSHTPSGRGVQQPGMTGQVKEDILTRMTELGIRLRQGCLEFEPSLFRRAELLVEPQSWAVVDVTGAIRELPMQVDQFGYTFCQVPIIYSLGADPGVRVDWADGTCSFCPDWKLSPEASEALFARAGSIDKIVVGLSQALEESDLDS